MADATIAPALLTRDDAAAYLGIRLTKLYDLTNKGEFGEGATVRLPPPTDGPGNRRPARRWKKAALDAFIERQTVSLR